MKIPLTNIRRENEKVMDEILAAMKEVIDSSSFILGPQTERFEKDFASYCDAGHCVSCSSGSAAIFIVLKALGIGSGDEVITPANNFIGAVNAMRIAGPEVRFVDIDPETHNISPEGIDMNEKTKAILPVHMFGHLCDIDKILKTASDNGVSVIEDACQSHAGESGGKRAPFGGLAVYSFYPSKNLGAFGDAGAIVTNDPGLAKRCRAIRDYGRVPPKKDVAELIGFNLRMDTLQAAVLGVKLRYLDGWVKRRRNLAHRYTEALSGIVMTPVEKDGFLHAYHLYVIRTERRDALLKHLNTKGIGAMVHYPVPCYKQGNASGQETFKNADKASREVISLPLSPFMRESEQDYIIDEIKGFLRQ